MSLASYQTAPPRGNTVNLFCTLRFAWSQGREGGHGWALPGGFVDYGESLEAAAVREAKEETSLEVQLIEQFYTYSDPSRDPRKHTISTVYIATAQGIPQGADDAKRAKIFTKDQLPNPIVFDHPRILSDYFVYKATGRRPKP